MFDLVIKRGDVLVFILRVRCCFDPLRVSMRKVRKDGGMSRGNETKYLFILNL